MNLYVKVAAVDLDSAQGRDFHPSLDMVGRFARVITLRALDYQLEPVNTDLPEPQPPVPADEDLAEDYPGQRITGPDYDTRDREGFDPGERIYLVEAVLVDATCAERDARSPIEVGRVNLLSYELVQSIAINSATGRLESTGLPRFFSLAEVLR
jgi:hypothetical protein